MQNRKENNPVHLKFCESIGQKNFAVCLQVGRVWTSLMVTYCRVMLWSGDFHICGEGLKPLNGKEAFWLYQGSAEHIIVWINESQCSWRVMLPFFCSEVLINYMFQTLLYGTFISSSVIFLSGCFITSRKARPGLMWARPPWPLLLSSWGLSAGFSS